ncbi:acyl carrier protein [Nocardiopsis sp. NPDC006198]|uniref:acyl carrier protein n=1 Tax=Nocardiopsis sp. NPDC006198 TaxID=3154472 RepID=UPI0033A3B48F
MSADDTNYQALVGGIVADALETRSVAPGDAFADLQVNSVLLLRIVAAIEDRLGTSIDIVDVLQAQTVGDLADLARSYALREEEQSRG